MQSELIDTEVDLRAERWSRRIVCHALLASCAAFGACSSGKQATPLRAADFGANLATEESLTPDLPAPLPSPTPPLARATELRQGDTSQPDTGPSDVVIISGPPSLVLGARDDAEDQGRPVTGRRELSSREQRLQVDQMVGQVNGRPVFAAEFLEPMDARFAREAERLSRDEWNQMAENDIRDALWAKLRDELLLAEFESSLTPEQRMGVLAFIQEVRDDLISGSLGSREEANRKFLETEGLDLEAKVEDLTERQFIIAQFRQAIGNRVHVSYADVQRYYDQHIDEFLPPSVAEFRIIRVRRSDADALRNVETALEERSDFARLAAQYSTWSPDSGNRHEVVLEGRNYTTAALFGPESLNAAVRALQPGERTSGIDVNASRYWVKLEQIRQPEGLSLYEAEDRIEAVLREQRSMEEEQRYLAQLFMRGNFSDIEQMIVDLLEFASERYLLQRRAFRSIGPDSASP